MNFKYCPICSRKLSPKPVPAKLSTWEYRYECPSGHKVKVSCGDPQGGSTDSVSFPTEWEPA